MLVSVPVEDCAAQRIREVKTDPRLLAKSVNGNAHTVRILVVNIYMNAQQLVAVKSGVITSTPRVLKDVTSVGR